MKNIALKLLLSATAMSLFTGLMSPVVRADEIDEFLGLETEIMPELVGPNKFTKPDHHKNPKWAVKKEDVEIDEGPVEGRSSSMVKWDEINSSGWLSIEKWLLERSFKDKTPDWKIRLRSEHNLELAGKILQCRGTCSVFRGVNPAKGSHLTRILEGDEIKTDKDSVAWIYLIDGTLLRLGSESSVSLQEINLGKNSFFYLVRLNQGHVFWHPRELKDYSDDFGPETDSYSLPLMIRSANLEFFERELFKKQSDQERMGEVLELGQGGLTAQVAKINELKKVNNSHDTHATKVFLVSPNASVISEDASFDMVYYPGGKSFLKFREAKEFQLHLRTFNSDVAEAANLKGTEWFEIDETGRSYSSASEAGGNQQILELLTKRIRTMELAREIWFSEFSAPLIIASKDPHLLSQKHGYKLWDEDMKNKRMDFLTQYTRRVESTNLRSIENLRNRLESKGETLFPDNGEALYRTAVNHYLKDLKKRYSNRKLQVKEMNDLQYYVWILRNGKF